MNPHFKPLAFLSLAFLYFSLATFASCLVFAGDLPNPNVTPGATNPQVTQENIQQTVCVRGYTKTIRPQANYTNKLKRAQLNGEYAAADQNPKHYEEDHLIPLSIGGNPTDVHNLWPQPRRTEWSAEKKDQLEFVLYKLLCRGEVQLIQAQQEVATDWIQAYKKYVPLHMDMKVTGSWD